MTQGPLLAIAWAGLSMHSTQHPPCVALRARLYLVSAGVWLHTRSVQASGSGGSGQVVARACAAAAEVWVACSKSLSLSMSLFAETCAVVSRRLCACDQCAWLSKQIGCGHSCEKWDFYFWRMSMGWCAHADVMRL